ncbi:uncharacterized protein METZ01_LOCUS364217, partial [marine metagenome]
VYLGGGINGTTYTKIISYINLYKHKSFLNIMEIPGIKIINDGKEYYVNNIYSIKNKFYIYACNLNELSDKTNVFSVNSKDINNVIYDPDTCNKLLWYVKNGKIVAEGSNNVYVVGEYLSTSIRKVSARKNTGIEPNFIFKNMLMDNFPNNFWMYDKKDIIKWVEKNFEVSYMIRIRNSISNLDGIELLKVCTHEGLKSLGLMTVTCRVKLLTKLKKVHFLNFYRLCYLAFTKCGMCPLIDYKVTEFLGQGAFGSVYKIKNKYNDKIFAIKDIECPSSSDVITQQKEINNLQRVDSENIVKIYQWGTTDE